MTAIIEEIPVYVAADAWVHNAVYAGRSAHELRKDLDHLVEQYLAQGGQIQVIETAAAVTPKPAPVFNRGQCDDYSTEERKTHESKRHRKLAARDEADAKHMRELLDQGVTNRWQLIKTLSISSSRLQRLIHLYFMHDPRVDDMKELTLEERVAVAEARRLAAVKQALADGVQGLTAIAAAAGMKTDQLHKLSAKYRLGIQPRQRGRKPATD